MNNNSSFLSNIPTATKNILIINVILFFAKFILGRKGIDLENILGMHYWQATQFNVYQIITYMFMHANITHIFFNMFALYMFGSILEHFWGAKKFLFYYFITGIGAAVVQQLVWHFTFNNYIDSINQAMSTQAIQNLSDAMSNLKQMMNLPVTIGASGAIFGLLLAYGWMFPNEKLMFIFIPVPIKAKYFIWIYGLMELTLGVADFRGDSVAHFAHLGGMLFGLILLIYWKRKGRLFL